MPDNPSPTQEVETWRLFFCDECCRPGWRFKDRGECRPEEHTHSGSHSGPVEVMRVEDHQRLLQAEVEKREEVEGERDQWREEAWQCYRAAGEDPDGADARHLNPGEAKAAVWQCRQDERECWDENDRLAALAERSTDRAEVAESKLSSAVEELEAWREEADGGELITPASSLIHKLADRLEPLLRDKGTPVDLFTDRIDADKGTEQAGVNNGCLESPVCKESGEHLDSGGTEQGGGDG